jgi:hypothetical protein
MWPQVSFYLDRFTCDETPGMYMNIYSKKDRLLDDLP